MADSIDFFPIQVEQSSWQASRATLERIRLSVFVDEQRVPKSEEFDGADDQAIHWIAWGAGDEPMGCARLSGNRIGRMAVLEPYRDKGVGSALLRAIIQYGLDNGIERLGLSAQVHALPFYRDNGFVVCSDEFTEAGIAHRKMELDLNRFSHRTYTPPLPDVSDEDRQRVMLEGVDAFAASAVKLAQHGHRSVRIFSHHLDPALYGGAGFVDAVQELAKHPQASIRLLVREPLWLSQHSHRLVELYQRLPSNIHLRMLNPESHVLHTDFMVVDQLGILYKQMEDRYVGYAIHYAPVEGRDLTLEFDSLWENAAPDPEVKRLYI